MSYHVSFISLGCAKNQVNCEQMMASVQEAGYTVTAAPEGADVVVVNTCGFLASAWSMNAIYAIMAVVAAVAAVPVLLMRRFDSAR